MGLVITALKVVRLLMAWDVRYASDGSGDFLLFGVWLWIILFLFRCNLLYIVSYLFLSIFRL
jgi:hypothetical protein